MTGALVVLDKCEVSVVVFDHDLIPGRRRDTLRHLQERANPAALIATSRLADDRLWAEALNLGALDLLAKPFDRCDRIYELARIGIASFRDLSFFGESAATTVAYGFTVGSSAHHLDGSRRKGRSTR